MKFNKYENLKKAKKALLKRGYTEQFRLNEGVFYNKKNKKVYLPKDLVIVEYHRIESKTKANETHLVFVVECKDKTKGIIISSYDKYTDMQLIKFMDKVKIKSRVAAAITS